MAEADPRVIRKWILGTVVLTVGLAALTAYLALETEDAVKRSFEQNLAEVASAYEQCEEALKAPPADREAFLKWLAKAEPPRPDVEKMVNSGRAKVAWGRKLPDTSTPPQTVFAYTTDPPVRGRLAVVTVDGQVRWLTTEEFQSAPKAVGEK